MNPQHLETNRDFYDRISHVYDHIADANEHKAREAGERALDIQSGERVLEVGFGTGNSLVHFAKSAGSDGHVSGIDVSKGMLAVTEKKLEKESLAGRVDLAVGDARALPYEDQSFDAAFASFTLELFPIDEIPRVLEEISRVLKPGGRIGIVSMATVSDGDKPSLLEKSYVWMHQHFPHIVDCQPIDVARLVTEAGFQIDHQIDMEIWTMPVRAVVGTR